MKIEAERSTAGWAGFLRLRLMRKGGAAMNAPAKINLALEILGKRPDGFHDLRMVMQSVKLYDTVTLRETDSGFTLRAGFDPEGEKSLEERAAEAFFAALGRPMPGLEITVEKRIPAYAGLGGGSADMAALLRLLRERYAPGLSQEELEAIGLSVGSDVPFCLRRGTCLAEGRGERLTALPPLSDCWIVLCKPDFDLSTPRMFALADGAAITRRPDFSGLTAALERGDLEGAARRLCNVFEEVLPMECRRAVECRKEALLSRGALGAAMSGSGPTVFGLFKNRETAESALEALEDSQIFLAEPEQV